MSAPQKRRRRRQQYFDLPGVGEPPLRFKPMRRGDGRWGVGELQAGTASAYVLIDAVYDTEGAAWQAIRAGDFGKPGTQITVQVFLSPVRGRR